MQLNYVIRLMTILHIGTTDNTLKKLSRLQKFREKDMKPDNNQPAGFIEQLKPKTL